MAGFFRKGNLFDLFDAIKVRQKDIQKTGKNEFGEFF